MTPSSCSFSFHEVCQGRILKWFLKSCYSGAQDQQFTTLMEGEFFFMMFELSFFYEHSSDIILKASCIAWNHNITHQYDDIAGCTWFPIYPQVIHLQVFISHNSPLFYYEVSMCVLLESSYMIEFSWVLLLWGPHVINIQLKGEV